MTSMEFSSVSTEKITTNVFQMNGVSVNGISNDPSENKTDQLSTSGALFAGLSILQNQIATLNTIIDNTNNSVITPAITSPLFETSCLYEYSNWEIMNNKAVYIGDQVNYIKLPSSMFVADSHYLIHLQITNLPSGSIEVRDKNGELLFTTDEVGSFYIDVDSEETPCSFKVIARDVNYGDTVIVPYLAVHRVINVFYYYLLNKIKDLSSIDGQGYVTRQVFDTIIEDMNNEITQAMANLTSTMLAHHNNNTNPHQVTCEQIGAALQSHTHSDIYYTKDEIQEEIQEAIETCSSTDHTHSQYLTLDQVDDAIASSLDQSLKNISTVAPLTLLSGPSGILPEIYNHKGITPPSQVLVTNNIDHDPESEFDFIHGLCSCNKEPIHGSTIMDAFIDYDTYHGVAVFETTDLVLTDKIMLHYQFHRNRKLKGYRVYSDTLLNSENGYAKRWSLFHSFNTFVHTVQSNDYPVDGYEVILPQAIDCNNVSLEILEVSKEIFSLNIGFIFEDVPDNEIGVTSEPILLSVPRAGNNLIFTLDLLNIQNINPINKIENIPFYIYLDVASNGIEQIFYTYIAPEFSVERNGIDVLRNQFHLGADITDPDYHIFRKIYNPIFGTLEIDNIEGCNQDLRVLYQDEGSWVTENTKKEVCISHTFEQPVYMVGYDLEWDKEFITQLPTDWTLHLKVMNNGVIDNVVIDSIKTYGGKINYNSNKIIYCKKFDKAYLVVGMELYLNNDNESGLYLTNLKPYLTQDFYSIPKNTMYNGNSIVNRIYLGTGTYKNGKPIIVNQINQGRICNIPLNNLELTSLGGVYKITNPFHTTDITCTLRMIDGDESNPPLCSVLGISELEITIKTFSSHKFTACIVRNW